MIILPSLEIVPAKYNTSTNTLLSQIPIDGTGDFTVSRTTSPVAGQSTRVNALGQIELVADNVPRLDYFASGGTVGCPALLVEPSAQNLALQSADFNTTWLAQSSATVNTNTAISPDGTQNADTINLAAVPDSRVSQSITVANSTTYTISCFYKNIALTAGQTFNMRFNNFLTVPNNLLATATIDLASGAATYTVVGTAGTGFSGTATGRVENYGNGWYRVSMTFTVGSAGGNLGGFQTAHVGSATARSFYAWGAQLETGSVATSYIPTTTGTVTRNADVISVSGAVSGSIGQASGTIYAEVDIRNAFAGTFISLDIGSGADFLIIGRTSGLAVIVQLRRSNGSVVTIITSSAVALGVHKIALGYTNGGYALYIDGVSAGTSTNSTDYPSAALTRCNLAVTAYNVFNDRIRAAALYPTRLTDTQLALLTSPYTNYSSMASALSYTLG